MSIFCNVGSILLGLGAWALPAAAGKLRGRTPWLCAGSFLLCNLSLLLQLVNMVHLCRIRDFAAIEDTIGAVAFAAGVLVIAAIILNVIAIRTSQKRK